MSKLIEQGRLGSSTEREERAARERQAACGGVDQKLPLFQRARAALSRARDTVRAAHRAHGRASPEGGRHGSLLWEADTGGGRLIEKAKNLCFTEERNFSPEGERAQIAPPRKI